ncbi:MAG: BamA/TamA family outer membrane protein [Methylophilales bacterium]|nr:BamA/TamA family outer membrane protein [Methylophilales bacterium]
MLRLRPLLIASSSILLALSASPILAAEPAAEAVPEIQVPPAPKFDISEFKIEGNTLISTEELQALVQPHTGKQKDFGDVQQALEAVQDAYIDLGYNAVRVNLPEQELEQGVISLKVIEQKISSIKVEGNTVYSTENALSAVPSLKEGESPNIKKIGSTLKIANENPTKQTAVLFTDSETQENTVEALVKVIDEKAWKAFITLDNTGTRESGHGRVSFGYQNFNMFGTDQRLTAQYITTPHYPQHFFDADHDVQIFALAYTIPLYTLGYTGAAAGDSIDLIGSYSNTTSSSPTNVAFLGAISGNGLVLGLHYNHPLPKLKDYEQKITFTFDNRDTRPPSSSALGPLTTGVSTTPLGLTYTSTWSPEGQQLSLSASGVVNWAGFDKNGHNDAFVPFLADSDFTKFNLNLDYLRQLPMDWQLHAVFNLQHTDDHLVSIEQFRAGGADTVRGFHESAASADKGYRATLEAITPDVGKKISENLSLRGVLFIDRAYLSNNDDTTGVNDGTKFSIGSLGAGLRLSYGKHVVGRVDLANVLSGDKDAGGTQASGDKYVHGSIGYTW